MKNIFRSLLLTLLISFSACDALDENLVDPLEVTPENVAIGDLYNSVQLQTAQLMNNSWYFPASMARMISNTNAFEYINASAPANFNGIWATVYEGLWPDIQTLIDISSERGLPVYEGTSRIIRAYTMMLLVDMFGDVPLTDANKGTEVISPAADPGSSVYEAAIAELDAGIALLQAAGSSTVAYDNFYGGDVDKWITLANTLKLRAAVTTRLVTPDESRSAINALIGGELIDSEDEDFQFSYGTNRQNPNSRHPLYNGSYEQLAGDYQSNYYMWMLRAEKLDGSGNPVIDPRIRYYFYRQVEKADEQDVNTYSCHFSNTPDQDAKPAHYDAVDSRIPYCISVLGDGYWGRDHLNNQGIPPDDALRTIYGLYPAGGLFDENSFESQLTAGTAGARGQGIWPIMLASFADFLRAEAALTLGTNDDPRALLESGMRKSIAKVQGFASKDPNTFSQQIDQRGTLVSVQDAFVPDSDDVDEYVNFVLDSYDAADADGKLDIVMKEYYISLFGNGIEAYNMYRRTGKPNNMAPPLETAPGPFMRSFFYPAVNVDRNSNSSQKSITDPVFWDNGSVDLY